jgi:cephalosporin hydroxylase
MNTLTINISEYDLLNNVVNLCSENAKNKQIPSDSYFSFLCRTILKKMKTQNIKQIDKLKDTEFNKKIYKNIKLHLNLFSKGRFVSYFSRVSMEDGKLSYNLFYPNKQKHLRDSSLINLISSQGKCWGPMIYKNLRLYKTYYDYCLYPMIIQEIKPLTIIELGSGNGSSAIWMNDICKSINLDTIIYSLEIHDIKKKLKENKMIKSLLDIHFINGDAYKIEKYFPSELLNILPHPWLIIEDCHHNTFNIMNYFHNFLKKDDYMIIEDPDEIDTGNKELEGLSIIKFMQKHAQNYVVDVKYCDFFGKNNCSFPDSIFKYI